MNILYGFLVAIEVLVSFLLIGIILIQKSKGGGFAGFGMASSVGENLFGSRAGNILTKATVLFTVIFLGNTLVMAKIQASGQDRSILDAYGQMGQIREVPDDEPLDLRELGIEDQMAPTPAPPAPEAAPESEPELEAVPAADAAAVPEAEAVDSIPAENVPVDQP